MLVDARKLDNNSLIEGDICIVGAGAAGISMALDWLKLSYRIILLESGGFEYEDQIQDLYEGKTSGQKYYPLKSTRLSYFGGTTGHWAGMCSPLDEIDFEKRDWIDESGWPITKKDLDVYYSKAQEILQIGPFNYDYNYWKGELSEANSLPFDPAIVYNKMWQFSSVHFGDVYKKDIINSNNVELYTYATLTDIHTTDDISNVQYVSATNHTGKTFSIRGKFFVLAGGAIQNARMLLASNTQFAKGLGNKFDLVGRYFMEHLEISSAELHLVKPFESDLYSWEYGVTKARAELAITAAEQKRRRMSNGTSSLSIPGNSTGKSRMEVWNDVDPRISMERFTKRAIEDTDNDIDESAVRVFDLSTRIEQTPNKNSRIVIGSEKDALGVPLANLNWQLSSIDKHSIREIYKIIGQQAGIAGIGRVRLNKFLHDENDLEWPDSTDGGWHHMGTTRMNNDPKHGVVDSECRVHGIANLFIAGSACFPTAGAVNPTLSLIALALRLSRYLKNEMKNV